MTPHEPKTSPEKSRQMKESREQRRLRERTNLEAQSILRSLQEQFLNFFMSAEETEGESVNNKIREIDAKWRLYCKRKNLIPAAYTVMDKYMEDSIKEYYENKEGKLKDSQEKAQVIETSLENQESELSNSQ
jgi:hypothetical protein